MEGILIGVLAAAAAATALLFWTLLVHPDVVLTALFRKSTDEFTDGFGWPEADKGSLRAARWAFGSLLFGLSFLCGAATTFLLTT